MCKVSNFISDCHFKFIFQKSKLSIVLINREAKIVDVNSAFLSLINYTKDEVLNQNFINFIHKTDKDIILKHFEKLISKELDTFNVEIKKVTKDNKTIWFDTHASSIEEENSISYVVLFLENITENKLLKEENLKKEKILMEQSKLALMGEMIDTIAHQWKQPLTTLSLYAIDIPMSVKAKEMDLNRANNTSEQILLQIRHMSETIDEFKGFFRPNKIKQEFNLNNLIEKTIFMINDELMKYKVKINIFGDKNITIFGVENEFKHVILNIINNAKDAFNENNIKDRKVNFYMKRDKKTILEIEDNAGGIEKKLLNKIFKPNFTTKEYGTGIGLYITKTIMKSIGANISVESEKNQTKFILEFN